MAERRIDPRKVMKKAIPASALLLILACATPVIASQNSQSDCAELEDAGLQVPVLKLASASIGKHRDGDDQDSAALGTQPATTAPAVPPKSTTTAAIPKQGLFDSTPLAKTQPGDARSTTTQNLESTERLPDIHTRIPGVSSVELQRFKRQMYRRDI